MSVHRIRLRGRWSYCPMSGSYPIGGGRVNDYDEWRSDVVEMTEWDRAVTEMAVRHSQGLAGDMEDARYER